MGGREPPDGERDRRAARGGLSRPDESVWSEKLEDLLPPEKFLRNHRSHIVKRDSIARIKTQPSGNGSVHLHSGRALPMRRT